MLTKSQEVRFEVSTFCHYNCKLCARPKMARAGDTMSNSLFKAILDKIQYQSKDQFRICDFSGMGEPLTDPGLIRKVEIAHDRKMQTILITNGLLLTGDNFIKLQRAGLDYCRISLHALPGNIEEYITAHGCQKEHAIEVRLNLEEILVGPRKTKIGIHITKQEVGNAEIEKIKDQFKTADSLEIWSPHNWASTFAFRPVQKRKKACTRIQTGPLQIQVDGSVVACCFDADGKTRSGSLITDNLDEIYAKMQPAEICQSCDQRNWGKAGILVYSSIDGPDRLNLTSSGFIKF